MDNGKKMVKVVTNSMSLSHKIKIREFGRIINPGEVFYVTDERYQELAGKNKYNICFVKLAEEEAKISDKVLHTTAKDWDNIVTESDHKYYEVVKDQVPEVVVIEPKSTEDKSVDKVEDKTTTTKATTRSTKTTSKTRNKTTTKTGENSVEN